MGRPIKKRFFGSDNVNDSLTYTTPGGEGIASFSVTAGSNYSKGISATVAVSPIGGTRATVASITTDGSGGITAAAVGEAGTGYTTAPALTFVKPGNVSVNGTNDAFWQDGSNLRLTSTAGLYVGMFSNVAGKSTVSISLIYPDGNIRGSNTYGNVASGTPIAFGDTGKNGAITAVLYTPNVTANSIQANAWTSSGSIGKQADIVKQEGARLYRVTNADDSNDKVKLVPTGTNQVNSPTVAAVTSAGGPVAAGQMTIEATDHNNGTYWVTKLASRTAVLVSGGTGTPGTFWDDYAKVKWTSTGVASATQVKIATND
jgi:hypothetical protein